MLNAIDIRKEFTFHLTPPIRPRNWSQNKLHNGDRFVFIQFLENWIYFSQCLQFIAIRRIFMISHAFKVKFTATEFFERPLNCAFVYSLFAPKLQWSFESFVLHCSQLNLANFLFWLHSCKYIKIDESIIYIEDRVCN